MGVLTDLASAQVKKNVKTLYGKVMTRPAQLVSDGFNMVYACDVEIGPTDPTGKINQFKDELLGIPEAKGWTLEDTLTVNTILHNVTIARGNADLIYADVGTPVTMVRSVSGQWQITGFSQEQPGTYNMVPVDLITMSVGTIIDLSIDTRLLTLGEMGSLRPWGQIPLGSSGIFTTDGQLIKIV